MADNELIYGHQYYLNLRLLVYVTVLTAPEKDLICIMLYNDLSWEMYHLQ